MCDLCGFTDDVCECMNGPYHFDYDEYGLFDEPYQPEPFITIDGIDYTLDELAKMYPEVGDWYETGYISAEDYE